MNIKNVKLGMISTNCYIVSDENTGLAAVIDPADNANKIIALLDEMGLTLKYIFITHAHFDHMLAASALKEATSAAIAVHIDDRELIKSEYVCKFHNLLKTSYKEFTPDFLANDGDVFKIGGLEAKFIHTPGHTPGSCVIAIQDCLFSGDTLFKHECGRCDLHLGNFDNMCASLKRLNDLDGDYRVFPGHGSETTLSHERQYNPYMLQAVSGIAF